MRNRLAVAMLALGLAQSPSVLAVTFQVTSTLDAVDITPNGICAASGGACTLRAAIQEANATAAADTILLPAGNYVFSIPGAAEDGSASGDLDIIQSLTIVAAGSASTLVDAAGLDRVFHVFPGATVEIDDLTITGGAVADDGGGIFNAGTLTVDRVVIEDNVAGGSSGFGGGGGVINAGTMTLRNSTISNNATAQNAGGVGNLGTMTIDGCTVSGNHAAVAVIAIGGGGGIGNADLNGGPAILTITNSTVSGNTSAIDGGGLINVSLYSQATTVALNNVTITANLADSDSSGDGEGGGISNGASGGTFIPGVLNVQNSIIAGNGDGGGQVPDCAGSVSSNGYNVVQSTAGCTIGGITTGNVTGAAPTLGPLAANGGQTKTHLPLGGSPALNAGSPATPGGSGNACRAADQRGVGRPLGAIARCDVGAVEVTVCGDGIPSAPVEACDDGPGNGLNGCCSGACTLVDGDLDGFCDASDNCSALFNPDQRNSDSQDGGDLCDQCPLDATQTCKPDQTGANAVGPGGGSVTTATGASISCPAGSRCGSCTDVAKSPCADSNDCSGGATCVATTFSVTGGNQSAFGLGSTSTTMIGGVTALGPAGQTFNVDPAAHPERNVLVTFKWLDGDNNSKVNSRADGTNTTVDETNLKAWRNGKGLSTCPSGPHILCSSDLPCPAGFGTCPIPKTCAQVAAGSCPTVGAVGVSALCCDVTANQFYISAYVFSEYGLGLDPCGGMDGVQLALSKLGPPAGDDKLRLQGTFQLPTSIGSLNPPSVYGIRLVVDDVADALIDVILPPGPYDPNLRSGWKVNGSGTTWTYINKTALPPGGIVKAVVKDQSKKLPGLTRMSAMATQGSFSATLAVNATVGLPQADLCFATHRAPPFVGPPCAFNAAGTTLKCK